MPVEFTIPLLLPSLNVRERQHWRTRSKFKTDLAWRVSEALDFKIPPHRKCPLPKVRVTVTRHTSRLMDEDNLAGSVKPLLDVLKLTPGGFGIILDDRPSCCTLVVRQEKSPARKQCTHVLIEEL